MTSLYVYKFLKRLADFFFAFAGLLFLFPLLLFLFIVSLILIGHPVFFTQHRAGLNGKPFRLVKFRTMSFQSDTCGLLLPDELRISPYGRILRTTSLDELPQLLNILFGSMSFVGPRPLLIDYLPLYTHSQSRRHLVLPGLTGLAQVKGRNSLSWSERLSLDVLYVENQSFCLDLRILLATFKIVLLCEGVNSYGDTTMKHFVGNTSSE